MPIFRYLVYTLPLMCSGVLMFFSVYFLKLSIPIFGQLAVKIGFGAAIYVVVLAIQYFFIRKQFNAFIK